MITALFARYRANPRLLPPDSLARSGGLAGEEPLDRAIADYIAGMTDRYAIEEYQRLFDPTVRV
jgi:dGTPase